MTNKKQMIEIIKAENPTLKVGDEKNGYIELSNTEYNAIISEWADARLDKEAKQVKAQAKAEAKSVAQSKLAALGLTVEDLTALGL